MVELKRGKKEIKNLFFGEHDYRYFAMYKFVEAQQYILFEEVDKNGKQKLIEEFEQHGTITKTEQFSNKEITVEPFSIMFVEKIEEYGYLSNHTSIQKIKEQNQ